MSILTLVITFLGSLFKPQRQLRLENLALRQQVAMLQQSVKRPRVSTVDRVFWILFSRYVDGWGAPRIHGELLKLGIEVSQATVSKYMLHPKKLPSQTWRAFLNNHADCLSAMDFFTVPTATFRVLYVFIVLSHDRRQVVYFNATEHPTARWTAQQLVETFPFDSAPRYLLRDRDAIYGEKVQRRIRSLGIDEVISAPRSPWQNPYVERVIGSIRRDCLGHVIVFNERHLRRILRDYFNYYHSCRTHLSLNKDSPKPRAVEPEALGNIVALPQVGGLHHRYTRAAA